MFQSSAGTNAGEFLFGHRRQRIGGANAKSGATLQDQIDLLTIMTAFNWR